MIDIILASISPRRQQLLSLSGLKFVTLSVEVDETVRPNELPQDYIVRMVEAKAQQACKQLFDKAKINNQSNIQSNIQSSLNKTGVNNAHQSKLIITADTIGVLPDGKSILIKPKDKEDAFAMWQNMSGSQHTVWTAVQLTRVDEYGDVIHHEMLLEKTEVSFIVLDLKAMENYWQTGEPKDKAGGYAIQGKGACWVERINGSYTNVVGLPLAQTLRAIEQMTHQ